MPEYKSVAYFVNWAIYARNHNPQDLPVQHLTHILYAFANIDPETGCITLTDPWSDTDKHYPTDSWNDAPNPDGSPNVYGCIKQLYLLKKKNRHLRVLLSVGGWTYSGRFAAFAAREEGRREFARSAVRLVEDLGLDGIDIDWEYPKDLKEGHDFAALLSTTRHALNAHHASHHPNSPPFDLTIAVSANPTNIANIPLNLIVPHLTFINLMAYDYAGTWSQPAAHQANLFPSSSNPATTPFSTAAAIEAYVRAGVPRPMIVLGMPLYGRAFAGTDGIGKPYSNAGGDGGSWENGVWDYKALPRGEHATIHEDLDETVSSYCYDAVSKLLVTYDTPAVIGRKAKFVVQEGLGGGMWWESSADKTECSSEAVGQGQSLISTFVNGLGGPDVLERGVRNELCFPGSKYGNLRRGFEAE